MNATWIDSLKLLIALVLSQVLLFNHIEAFAFLNPYIYPLFILTLPVKIRRARMLVLGFLLGLCIDFFQDTGGIHAFASTLLAYLRPRFVRLVATQGGAEFENFLPDGMGFRKFFVYVFSSLLIHHMALLGLDGLRFTAFHWDLLLAILNAAFSFVVIWMLSMFFQPVKRNI